jgi:hypothetical protein
MLNVSSQESSVYLIDLPISVDAVVKLQGIILLNCNQGTIDTLAKDLHKTQLLNKLCESNLKLQSLEFNQGVFKKVLEIEICYLHNEPERLVLQLQDLKSFSFRLNYLEFHRKVTKLLTYAKNNQELKFLDLLSILKEAAILLNKNS